MIPRLVKLLVIVLVLTGCEAQTEEWQLKRAIDFCSDKGGIDYIRDSPLFLASASCVDGSYLLIRREEGS